MSRGSLPGHEITFRGTRASADNQAGDGRFAIPCPPTLAIDGRINENPWNNVHELQIR
jgi:hypothetical protein